MAGLTFRYFEQNIISPTLKEITLRGKFKGFDSVTGAEIIGAITPFSVIDPTTAGNPPVAGVISGTMPNATTANLTVVYTDPGDRPPVTTWHWYRDGAEKGTTTEPTRTFSDTTVPNDSSPHSFFVRGESVDGLGDPSNLLSLTFGGTTVVAPTAATSFARHNLTQLQVDLSWIFTPDSRTDKIALFRQGQTPGVNPPLVDNLDPSAAGMTLVFSTIGLGPGDRIAQLGVARHIPTAGAPNAGWSPISNVITFNIPLDAVVHDPVMGQPMNDEWTAAKLNIAYPTMPATRMYSFYDQGAQSPGLVAAITQAQCRVVALTPNGFGENLFNPRSASATVVQNACTAVLEDCYYFSDGTPRTGLRSPTTGSETHLALDNETDRGANPTATYINAYGAARAAVWRLNGDGTRRYPRASVWIDMTQNNIRTGGSATSFKPLAQFLDGFGCSMYPPGRQAHTAAGTVNDNVTFSSYSSYIDSVITCVQDWMLTGSASGGRSPITMFGTWEVGIPIDHPFRNSSTTSPPSGEPTDLTNFSIRPRYLAGGIDSTGKDWTGFLNYIHDALDAIGCIMREQLYWSQESNPDIPNPLWHDQRGRSWSAAGLPAPYNAQTGAGSTRAEPDSEEAWFNWVPGSRLPQATSNH